jgi:quinol monooxygenase YgiN
VLEAIRSMIEPSRAEPGCRFYQPSRDPEDSRVFFFYEIYDDEDAYVGHGESEHFRRYGLGEAIPLLESRERRFYVTVD